MVEVFVDKELVAFKKTTEEDTLFFVTDYDDDNYIKSVVKVPEKVLSKLSDSIGVEQSKIKDCILGCIRDSHLGKVSNVEINYDGVFCDGVAVPIM